MMKRRFLQKIIFSKTLLVFLFLFLIILAVATSKIVKKRYKINKEINNFKKEIKEMEKQNSELTQLIEYLDTLSFKEKEARLKLGLQKEGEKTVIITSPYSGLNSEKIEEGEKEKVSSNALKWWEYFFSRNNKNN